MGKILSFISNRWKEKGTKAAVGVVITWVATFFGADLTAEQMVAVTGGLGALITVITMFTKTAKAADRDD